MLALKPLNSPTSVCPQCKSDNEGFGNFDFFGQHILSSGVCRNCATEYTHNWPVGHGALFPITFSKNGVANYPDKSALWMAKPLIHHYKSEIIAAVEVKRMVKRSIEQGWLINCLDPCYGHVIWKLLNAWRFKDLPNEQGVVVVVPANCLWMVPDFVAEVWLVEVPLNQLQARVPGLNEMITQRFSGQLLIPQQSSHPDHGSIDLQAFFKTNKFDLINFSTTPLQITLVWREDRLWLPVIVEPIWRLFTKFKWKKGLKFLARLQANRYTRLAVSIKKKLPEAQVAVAGLGTAAYIKGVEDLRSNKPDKEQELAWCRLYARSQVVIGVHGSSMQIPTALSAGFINLLPSFKKPFMGEDIMMNHPARLQTYLGRHLDARVSHTQVADHVVSMYQGFNNLFHNKYHA